MLGDTEIWTYINNSNMAHPMTMHGGSFYILDRNGLAPDPWERGPKSVVHVGVGDSVRVIMRFARYATDGWPLMYHCHNLAHINHMMWQFIVVDPHTAIADREGAGGFRLFPVPADDVVLYEAQFPVLHVAVADILGREVLSAKGNGATTGHIALNTLRRGQYTVRLLGAGRQAVARLLKE